MQVGFGRPRWLNRRRAGRLNLKDLALLGTCCTGLSLNHCYNVRQVKGLPAALAWRPWAVFISESLQQFPISVSCRATCHPCAKWRSVYVHFQEISMQQRGLCTFVETQGQSSNPCWRLLKIKAQLCLQTCIVVHWGLLEADVQDLWLSIKPAQSSSTTHKSLKVHLIVCELGDAGG